jgi:hypothetical protein
MLFVVVILALVIGVDHFMFLADLTSLMATGTLVLLYHLYFILFYSWWSISYWST